MTGKASLTNIPLTQKENFASVTDQVSSPQLAKIAPMDAVEMQQFHEIWPLLCRLGFRKDEKSHAYCRPKVHPSKDVFELDRDYFMSFKHLRKHLCAYGVEVDIFPSQLSHQELQRVEKWIRSAVFSDVDKILSRTMMERGGTLTEPQVCRLLQKIGFSYDSASQRYLLPGETVPGKNSAIPPHLCKGRELSGENGLAVYLARFGFPKECEFQGITQNERLELGLYLTKAKDLCTL
jgi:hypothetical protein